MPLRTLLLIVLCVSFACVGRAASAAAADSPPTADEVEQFIATTLPGYWKVDQLSLSPTSPTQRQKGDRSLIFRS